MQLTEEQFLMLSIFLDAFYDTAITIPLLLLIYVGIELLEYKLGEKLRNGIKHAGRSGPALGAVFGCVPQCGFSVIATTLYTKRLVTVGTLLAVYLSTSDEAIPVILAQPQKSGIIWQLLFIKVIIAVIAGFSIDLLGKIFNSKAKAQTCASIENTEIEADRNRKHSEEVDKGCCGHSCVIEKPNIKELFFHPLIHTIKVFFFIFIFTFLINIIMYKIGEENLKSIFLGKSIFQPVITAFIGLIPNCAASVAITQVYLNGAISFGSAIAGLSAGAGLGVLLLFKENRDMKDTLKIIGMLLLVSISAGIIVQCF